MEGVGDGVAVLGEQRAAETRRAPRRARSPRGGRLLAREGHGRQQRDAPRRVGRGGCRRARRRRGRCVPQLAARVDGRSRSRTMPKYGIESSTRRLERDAVPCRARVGRRSLPRGRGVVVPEERAVGLYRARRPRPNVRSTSTRCTPAAALAKAVSRRRRTCGMLGQPSYSRRTRMAELTVGKKAPDLHAHRSGREEGEALATSPARRSSSTSIRRPTPRMHAAGVQPA